jgi:hypothetical protein
MSGVRVRALVLAQVVVLALVAVGAVVAFERGQDQEFPHLEHARLFPLCTGCHEGVPDGDRTRFYPSRTLCEGCHNGTDQKRVSWNGAVVTAGNLKFSHPQHESKEQLDCSICHTREGQPRMAVEERRAVPERCFACHAHQAREHYVDARCSQCHVPLSRTSFTAARVEKLPEPPSHRQPAFLEKLHGELAKTNIADCQVCHTRERCAACHVNAAQVVEIRSLEPRGASLELPAFRARRFEPASHRDPEFIKKHGAPARADITNCATCHTRPQCATCHVNAQQMPELNALATSTESLRLPVFGARYFLPQSHRDPEWIEEHGGAARTDINSCSTCHTRESCATCHAVNAPKPIRSLPGRMQGAAPGVTTTRRAPATHRTPFFAQEHGSLAAASRQTCAGCHARTECEKCHTAQSTGRDRIGSNVQPAMQVARVKASGQVPPQDTSRRARASVRHRAGYHPANFMERHAGAAYNRNLECANCHETTRFCRACHEQRGMGTSGRLQAGFHDAQPLWLLNHGKPARQGLESCASCHKQTDCMQCHSSIGSFRISPHGPGFDAKRVQARNQRLCFACHLSDPLQTGTP